MKIITWPGSVKKVRAILTTYSSKTQGFPIFQN